MDAKKIGLFIAAARRARGLTQQQLAEQLGVTNRAVSKWETGQGLPDIALLPALAAALEVTVDALLAGGETAAPAADSGKAPAEPAAEASQPESAPALARMPRRQPTRQELDAAVLACRQLPAVRLRRLLLGALGLAGLVAGVGLSLQSFFDGSGTAPLTVASLVAGLILLAFAALTPWLRTRLWRGLCGLPDGVLYPEELRWDNGAALPLVELALVRRYRGCTVLVWDRSPLPLAVTVPDDTCTGSASDLEQHLTELVPAVCCLGAPRTPRLRQLPVLLALVVTAAVVLSLAMVPELGFAGTISPTGTMLMLRRDPETGLVTDLHSGETFPYPVVGSMKKQWMTGDCCAITYQTTDGTTHVFLATYGDRGSGLSYYYVAPLLQGTWRQYEDPLNPGVMLRNAPGSAEIQILSDAASSDYGQIYDQTVQFGTLGVALCDKDGLPHWTVVLGRDYDAEEGVDPDGSLILCPVSMAATEAVTLHYYSEEDQDRDMREALGLPSAEEEAARQQELDELAQTPPSFSAEQDYTVRSDGVFFTWDGGQTYSQAMEGSDEVTSTADIQPCVMTDTLGAFLTVSDFSRGQSVTLHLTQDKGQTWQEIPIEDFTDLHPINYLGMDFTDDSSGWIAISTGWSMGTGMGASFYTTRDGGSTWQAQQLPGKVGNTDTFSGVTFYSDQVGAATTDTPNDGDWCQLFLTQDGGQSWQQADLPWTSTPDATIVGDMVELGVTAPGPVTGIQPLENGGWQVTLSQGVNSQQEIVLEADTFDGLWYVKEVRDLS